MRLTVLAALGAATVAAAAGAAVGWHYAPSSDAVRTHLVLATVPTNPPVYVQPRCAVAPQPAFQPIGSPPPRQALAGRVPSGFVPVRAIKCDIGFQTGGVTVTQSQTATSADLQIVLATLRPPRIEEPYGPRIACAAVAQVPLAVALVDAHGTAVSVDLPRDQCGLYVDSSVQRLTTAHWTVTATTQAPLP